MKQVVKQGWLKDSDSLAEFKQQLAGFMNEKNPDPPKMWTAEQLEDKAQYDRLMAEQNRLREAMERNAKAKQQLVQKQLRTLKQTSVAELFGISSGRVWQIKNGINSRTRKRRNREASTEAGRDLHSAGSE